MGSEEGRKVSESSVMMSYVDESVPPKQHSYFKQHSSSANVDCDLFGEEDRGVPRGEPW